MNKKLLAIAALVLIGSAAILFLLASSNRSDSPGNKFVRLSNGRFVLDGKPFRFVGANVAVMYRDEDRQRMSETLKQAATSGIRVVRVWAFGEGGPNDVKPIADFADWPRTIHFVSHLINGTKKLLFTSTT
jgi:mannan endo-1,4-beta-mannosidase